MLQTPSRQNHCRISRANTQARGDARALARRARRGAPSRTPAARSKRRQRAHVGDHYVRGFWLSGYATEALLLQFVLSGRLTESQAMDPRCIDQALRDLLEEAGHSYAR